MSHFLNPWHYISCSSFVFVSFFGYDEGARFCGVARYMTSGTCIVKLYIPWKNLCWHPFDGNCGVKLREGYAGWGYGVKMLTSSIQGHELTRYCFQRILSVKDFFLCSNARSCSKVVANHYNRKKGVAGIGIGSEKWRFRHSIVFSTNKVLIYWKLSIGEFHVRINIYSNATPFRPTL